ncbi:MAG: M42 family peptidase [Eubacterium sp.]|nr:M42 family peptidase [Eubacterium sp.]
MLKELCLLNGTSGDESKVRDYIINQINGYCEYTVDNLGSIIALKKGAKTPSKKVMLCAHMDEVGFIITSITDDGYLKFSPVGGIDSKVCLDRVIEINGVKGVIGVKPVHQLTESEKDSTPEFSKLYIDIGAENREQAEALVDLGDYAYFSSEYYEFGNGFIKSKALDDRIGCMLLIELIKSDLEYDTYFCFNVQEEVGLRGASCTSYSVGADISIVLEATTAGDLCGVSGGERVCALGDGPVVSFMDRRTIYDKELYSLAFDIAKANGVKIQTKTAIAGGNDAGAIQTSGKGSRVLAVSLPCRYIHSAASVVKISDIKETRRLISLLLTKIYD